MHTTVEIITIGDELLNGTVTDTNSGWLGQQAQALGVVISGRTVVPDVIEDVVRAMSDCATRADVVITSGGLGPTVDDLTAEASAAWCGEAPAMNAEALGQIRARREAAGRALGPIDEKQALLPRSAAVLENAAGIAPGFRVIGGPRPTTFLHLPGVPREWRQMCTDHVLPELAARVEQRPAVATWKFFGVTESELALKVAEFDTTGIELHYRAHFPEIHLAMLSDDAGKIANLREALMPVMARRYFGDADARFTQAVNAGLRARGFTVATAESCTGGLVAQYITSEPGSSDVFETGVVTYSNEAKTALLGVDPELIAEHGAVSKPVVTAMAQGIRTRSGSTLGVATSGIAGPGGGTPDKPVGTIHVALATPDRVRHRLFQFPFERERNRVLTAYAALELVRKECQLTN